MASARSSKSAGEDSAPQKRPLFRPWFVGTVVGVPALALFIAWWIMIHMPGSSHRGPLPPADDALRSLATELKTDVTTLAGQIGERNLRANSQELAQAARFIQAEFTKAGYKVSRQEYDTPDGRCANVEAELPGQTLPNEIVIVGAHYDSCLGAPGANDNGSGVAGVLALARRFAGQKTSRTLRFVAFTNEEPPYFQTSRMGSLVYARRCRAQNENLTGVMILETIGYYNDKPGTQHYPPPFNLLYPSEGNFIGVIGNVGSRSLVHSAVATFRANEPFPCQGGALPESIPGVGYSDHWSFWRTGYSAVMVTDTAMLRYSQYHMPGDTPDKVNYDRTARVIRGLTKVVSDWAGTQNPP
jgi:Zn-dependent M28 family amino/carboxypeptidase